MVAEPDHRRLVFPRRTLLALGSIGGGWRASAWFALRLGSHALARRPFGVMAARIGAALRALAVLERGRVSGPRAGGALAAGRTLARSLGFVVGR